MLSHCGPTKTTVAVDRYDADVLRSEAHFRLECDSTNDDGEQQTQAADDIYRCTLYIESCEASRHAGDYELLVTPLDDPSEPLESRCHVDIITTVSPTSTPAETPTSVSPPPPPPRVDIVQRLPDSLRVKANDSLRLECTLSKPVASGRHVKWSHHNVELHTDTDDADDAAAATASGVVVAQSDDGCKHWLVIHNVQPVVHDGTYQLDADGALSNFSALFFALLLKNVMPQKSMMFFLMI